MKIWTISHQMGKDVNSPQFCSVVTTLTLTLWFLEVHWDKDTHISSGCTVLLCCKCHVKLGWLDGGALFLVYNRILTSGLSCNRPAVWLPFLWPQHSGLLILLLFSKSHAFTSHSFLTDEQLTCSWMACYSLVCNFALDSNEFISLLLPRSTGSFSLKPSFTPYWWWLLSLCHV